MSSPQPGRYRRPDPEPAGETAPAHAAPDAPQPEAEVGDEAAPHLADAETDADAGGSRAGRRGRGVLAGLGALTVLLIGALVGAGVFLASSPTVRPPAVELEPEDVASARSSIATAKMMIDMIATTVDSGTAGIEQAVEAIDPTFAAIDTAAVAAEQMSTGLDEAPDLQGAAAGIQNSADSVDRALGQAEALAGTAAALDGLVGPAVDGLERAGVPETQELIDELRAVQGASDELAAGLGDLEGLRGEMRQVSGAVGPAAAEIDGSLGEARAAADRLQDGLVSLSAARADTEQAASSLVDGISRLDSVLTSISGNLDSARENLTTGEEPVTQVFDHADRTGAAVAAGAGTALVLMVIGGGIWVLRTRRRTGSETPPTGD